MVFRCLYFFWQWVGLRGAVPIVFATYPMLAGVSKSQMIFNIVFFIVLTSVILQGTTLAIVAQWLGLSKWNKALKRLQLVDDMGYDLKNALVEFDLTKRSTAAGKSIVQLQFPKTALIILLNRNGNYITLNGVTILEEKDKLLVMTDNDNGLEKVNQALGLS